MIVIIVKKTVNIYIYIFTIKHFVFVNYDVNKTVLVKI